MKEKISQFCEKIDQLAAERLQLEDQILADMGLSLQEAAKQCRRNMMILNGVSITHYIPRINQLLADMEYKELLESNPQICLCQ